MTNGTYLTRDQILGAADLPAEDVQVPEWGGVVRVRGMTAAQREIYRQASKDNQDLATRFVAMVIVDDSGRCLFSESDIAALGAKSTVAIERVLKVAMRLSGLQPGAAEQAEKNSGPSPSANSPLS